MLIPLTEIVQSVRTENPWWETPGIPKRFDKMPRRTYFDAFHKLVANERVNRAVILLGPRRVGKTVMTQHLVGRLISDGVDPRLIMYVSIDTPTYTNQSLQFFLNLHREQHAIDGDATRYIIFDEIQYLANWEQHLKVLVDKNPEVKFIASGSAAAALRLASAESGAGRFTEFMLPPLTFEEYLHFIGKENIMTAPAAEDFVAFHVCEDMSSLNREFINYINYGGYPEAVMSEDIRSDAARYIKNDIIDKVLLRDLPQLYGITNIQELNKLFTSLAYMTGQEVNLESLAQNSGISKPTITRYMEYLEAAFLIFRIRRVDESAKTFVRERSFKVYLTNPSMRAALFSPVNDDSDKLGHLVETAILGQWFHSGGIQTLHYARWKRTGKAKMSHGDHAEIDIVELNPDMTPAWFVEIKWSDSAHKKDECWGSIYEFVKRHPGIHSGVFTTRSEGGVKMVHDTEVKIVPSSAYCYTVGRNAARSRDGVFSSMSD